MREEVLYELFLYLHNVYGTLDWDICLKIIAEYGVGSRAIQILQTYWGRLTMADRAREYYGYTFKGYYGVTYGDPCPPCY